MIPSSISCVPTGRRPAAERVRGCRGGFTLIELLVATTASLLLILALAQGFSVVSQTVTLNRATVEMTGQLRGVTLRLRKDLDGITSPVVPWLPSSVNRGYVELHDNPAHDMSNVSDTSLGDIDDMLMFTTRSVDEPFEGRLLGVPIQSIDAEVAWWTVLNDVDKNGLRTTGEYYMVYRRALLVRPDLNGNAGFITQLPDATSMYSTTNQSDLQRMYNDIHAFMSANDVSVRFVRQESGSNVRLLVVANSLADLALRQNRFAHDNVVIMDTSTSPPNYTYRVAPLTPYDFALGFFSAHVATFARSGNQVGDDVMLTNVLAFDLRVFDPTAPISIYPGEDGAWGIAGVDDDQTGGDDLGDHCWPGSDDTTVTPGEPGYGTARSGSPLTIFTIGHGAFVDLNYFGKHNYGSVLGIPHSQFSAMGGSSAPATTSRLLGAIYDTWPLDYENNQIDENSAHGADEAMNGLDDNGIGGIDDISERETWPPYPYELRSIQVRVRIIEPDTRQVRQSTVTADFASD